MGKSRKSIKGSKKKDVSPNNKEKPAGSREQRQQQQQQKPVVNASTTANTTQHVVDKSQALAALHMPLHDFVPPRLKKVSRRLEALQEEKARIEEQLRQFKAQKDQKQNKSGDTKKVIDQPEVVTDASFEPSPQMTSLQKQIKSHQHTHPQSHFHSDVSSLPSRGASYHQSSEEEEPIVNDSGDNDDEVSVMTEDFYHYDVRGRRLKDEDYIMEETETTAAHYQNVTGRSIDQGGKSKKKKGSNKQRSDNIDTVGPQPRVMIEWKRGKSYKPEANLAYDVLYNHHPTDLSLLVADDKSFFDDLSFSSGDDSKLAAAVTDMPMEIDWIQGGDDDDSVNSALHSECSVSVAVGVPLSSSSKSSKRQQNNRHGASGLGIPTATTTSSAVAQHPHTLYQRSNSLDQSDDSNRKGEDDGDDDDSSQDKKESSRRRKRRGTKDGPPPLTSDMSLLDGKMRDGSDYRQQDQKSPQDEPPIEISFSELSRSSIESLGSDMCGASIALQFPQTDNSNSNSRPKKDGGNNNKSNNTENNNKSSKKNKNKKNSRKSREPVVVAPSDNILGTRDSETEENELSMCSLAFSKIKIDDDNLQNLAKNTGNKESRKDIAAKTSARGGKGNDEKPMSSPKVAKSKTNVSSSITPKPSKPIKRASTDADVKKKKRPDALKRHNSDSTLGGATGVDTTACVAEPKKQSPTRKENEAAVATSKKVKSQGTASSPKRHTRKVAVDSSTGLKKASANVNLDRQDSNSTCNSSLTSIPDASAKCLVIEGASLVK